jgi:hypothetical protein
MAAGQLPVVVVVSMPKYALNTCSKLGALDAEHRGVGPHEDLSQTSAVAGVRAAPATALAA